MSVLRTNGPLVIRSGEIFFKIAQEIEQFENIQNGFQESSFGNAWSQIKTEKIKLNDFSRIFLYQTLTAVYF